MLLNFSAWGGPNAGALVIVAARLRHVAGTRWGTKRYLQMNRLADVVAIA